MHRDQTTAEATTSVRSLLMAWSGKRVRVPEVSAQPLQPIARLPIDMASSRRLRTHDLAVTPTMEGNMLYCKFHCRTCGGHFAALEAFDAHRTLGRRSDMPAVRPAAESARS